MSNRSQATLIIILGIILAFPGSILIAYTVTWQQVEAGYVSTGPEAGSIYIGIIMFLMLIGALIAGYGWSVRKKLDKTS